MSKTDECILKRCNQIQDVFYEDLNPENLVIFFVFNEDGTWRDNYCLSKDVLEYNSNDPESYYARWIIGKDPMGRDGKPDKSYVYLRVNLVHPSGKGWKFDLNLNVKRPGKTISMKKTRKKLPAYKLTSMGKERIGCMDGNTGEGRTHGQDDFEVFDVELVKLIDLPELYERCSTRVDEDCEKCDLELEGEEDVDIQEDEDAYDDYKTVNDYEPPVEYRDHEEDLVYFYLLIYVNRMGSEKENYETFKEEIEETIQRHPGFIGYSEQIREYIQAWRFSTPAYFENKEMIDELFEKHPEFIRGINRSEGGGIPVPEDPEDVSHRPRDSFNLANIKKIEDIRKTYRYSTVYYSSEVLNIEDPELLNEIFDVGNNDLVALVDGMPPPPKGFVNISSQTWTFINVESPNLNCLSHNIEELTLFIQGGVFDFSKLSDGEYTWNKLKMSFTEDTVIIWDGLFSRRVADEIVMLSQFEDDDESMETKQYLAENSFIRFDDDEIYYYGFSLITGEYIMPDRFIFTKIKGDLDFSGTSVAYLPYTLHVDGTLNLSGTLITEIPEEMEVGKDLDLSYTDIESIPYKLVVGRDIDLSHSSIKYLPEGLVVGGDLNLSHTPIASLPEVLTVNGDLDISYTSIESIPEGIDVYGDWIVKGSPAAFLPEIGYDEYEASDDTL